MFIQTETTPNPLTLKFIPGEPVLSAGKTAQFNRKADAGDSPLALALFELDGVEAIFLAPDFISVTKAPMKEWGVLKTEILTTIMEHFVAGKPVLISRDADASAEPAEEDSEIVTQIKELIETRVRPAVAQDGGDIIFRGFENGVVKLELHGACSGCPSSTITLKNGIENMLKHYVPEVESVESVDAMA